MVVARPGLARNVFFCFINCLCHPAVSVLSPSCSFCFNSLCLILNSEGNNDHLLMVFIVHLSLTFLLCLLSLYLSSDGKLREIFSGSDQRRDQRGRLQRVSQVRAVLCCCGKYLSFLSSDCWPPPLCGTCWAPGTWGTSCRTESPSLRRCR